MRFLTTLSVLLFLINGSLLPQDNISVRLAAMLQRGEEIQKLKSRDRIRHTDQIRLFVKPVNDCYMYLIYSDDKDASYLNYKSRFMSLKSDKTYIYPSAESYYNFDSSSTYASFTIICSKGRINDLESLFKKSKISRTAWMAYEDTLSIKLKYNFNEVVDKPFTIAGNVRSLNSEFQGKLQLFSGEKIIMRKYEIEIKK